MSVFLHEGDCLDILKTMSSDSVDSVITDPPGGISFMGKAWDSDKGGRDHWITWMAQVAAECLRVIKPGGHALVWALPRTSHWTATAWEDAGWEVRDRIAHLFGNGFPKSHNLAGDLKGWGTALKPACEDWWLLRKPLIGTVLENVLAHGTGAMNIDACRVEVDAPRPGRSTAQSKSGLTGLGGAVTYGSYGVRGSIAIEDTTQGRWPANVTHDGSDEVLEAFAAFGEKQTTMRRGYTNDRDAAVYGKYANSPTNPSNTYADTGTAARFFYCAKASKAERNGSKHPTVKPVNLMRYLCKLVTPKGGTVLDPFAGSGTTGEAATHEGFNAILIEQEPEYCTTIRCRFAEKTAKRDADAGQGVLPFKPKPAC
jgi:site-specific DNA-methyltransferase (adenine-specific)